MGRDLLLYLWSGPISPLYGKNKMATLEMDFLAKVTDRVALPTITNSCDLRECHYFKPIFSPSYTVQGPTWKEHKNPYYNLLNDRSFCEKLLKDFDCDPENGLIVNGHVPVLVRACHTHSPIA